MDSDDLGISKIADKLLNEIEGSLRLILRESDDSFDDGEEMKEYNKFTKSIEQFQPLPQLLDSRLRNFINRVIQSYTNNCLYDGHDENQQLSIRIAKVFYQFSKVRGTKPVSNCLSSDISLIGYVLRRIESADAWEEHFFLLMWLSVLILAPFPLVKLDPMLPENIYQLGFRYLRTGGKERDAASILMARFLSRVDNYRYLDCFISEYFNSISWNLESNVMIKMGMLSTVNRLLKVTTLDQLRNHLDMIFLLISNLLNEDRRGLPSSILRLFIKILGKLSLFFLKQERYDSIEDILTHLLHLLSHNDTVIRYCVAKQISKIGQHLDPDSRNVILEALVQLLGISHLSKGFQDNLDINSETIDIQSYHGVLLTLGEFCRLRLMTTEWISITSSVVHRTLFVEQHRLTYSAGSNVRDASCFDCWSIFKKYHDSELPIIAVVTLFKDLMLSSCFDGDLMIRRAASATLQELIGRHGDRLFLQLSIPTDSISRYKVRLIEILDYTVLGHTQKSYQLPIQIYSELDELLYSEFMKYLLESGIKNYNYSLRKLSAQCLRRMAQISDRSDVNVIIDGLRTELLETSAEGLMYSIAELLTLLPSNSVDLSLYSSILSNFTFDFHRDGFHKGEEYLHLLRGLVKRFSLEPTLFELETVFNIIRCDREEIISEFVRLASVLNDIPEKYANKWLYYVRNGNLASAKALGYSSIMTLKNSEVLGLLHKNQLDAKLRSSLVDSISIFLQRGGNLNGHQEELIDQLDDYTVTNKGDVGSFIRLSAIDMISTNRRYFWDESSINLRMQIEKKLLRLACEVMDNVKLAAFSLLTELKGWKLQQQIDQSVLLHNPEQYFILLLKIYDANYLQDEECSTEFWKGFSFSGGSSQAVDLTINAAVYAFLRSWEELADTQKCSLLGIILSLLRASKIHHKNPRFVKMQTSCLNFVCNLLELNLQVPPEFDLKVLFVRTYNLTLGTSKISRLSVAIRTLTNLYLRDENTFKGCKGRLEWLGEKHHSEKVKAMALEGLKEIEFEQNK
ncbi:hypothetical protein FOA43_004294 [Brettanomyces nanus]|uniref:Tubulin-folding cofactor D ARM repeats domain-containing protein n=1 Tax=Eeniella nana TaxID=13502 RepID=A0A875RQG7_EENNA|nr:uncharacterized protein FOA43_004294 [Brettanomyces nanus]QPG76900.1 hypothetical protein FOA43_004294 [Brettanomyces nanus]